MSYEHKYKPIPELAEIEIRRFWSHVDKRGAEECWPWMGSTTESGYGVYASRRFGRYKATRVMLRLTTGIDPLALFAVHTCENDPGSLAPLCVNPRHLVAGTHQENMVYTRGRKRENVICIGELNPNARLKEPEVLEIMRRLDAGETVRDLAVAFNVTWGMISHISTGKSWKHIGGDRKVGPSGGYKLTPENIAYIRDLRAAGLSQQKIANILGNCTQVMVSKILRGDCHVQKLPTLTTTTQDIDTK